MFEQLCQYNTGINLSGVIELSGLTKFMKHDLQDESIADSGSSNLTAPAPDKAPKVTKPSSSKKPTPAAKYIPVAKEKLTCD